MVTDVSDMNEMFQQITDILQEVFVNEDSVQRVLKTTVGRSTMLVGFIQVLFFSVSHYLPVCINPALSALALLVGLHKGHLACKNFCFRTTWRRRFHIDLGPLRGSSLPVDLWAGEGETQLS